MTEEAAFYTIKAPPPPAWRLYLGSNNLPYNFVITVPEGLQPRGFYRIMQRICLGFYWEKIK